MKRLKSLVLILLLSFCLKGNAEKITFAYDENGNRVSRTFTVTAVEKVRGRTAEVVNAYLEELNRRVIRIWHDTHGMIGIEIPDFVESDDALVSVFSSGGAEVLHREIGDSRTEIDISERAGGVYVLTIVLNGEQTVWKIIKG